MEPQIHTFDPRRPGAAHPHPGHPTRQALLAPLVSRLLHPFDTAPIAVCATMWDPTGGRDVDVRVVQVLPEDYAPDEPPFVLVESDGTYMAVCASLLCDSQDGRAVPRYRFQRLAMVSFSARRGIVFDGENRYEVVVGQENDEFCVRVEPLVEGTHIGMWLQPALGQVENIDLADDPYPFLKLQSQMRDQRVIDGMFVGFGEAIDGTNDAELRQKAAEVFAFYEPHATEIVWAQFRKLVLERELPSTPCFEAALAGRGAVLARELAAKHGIPFPEPSP